MNRKILAIDIGTSSCKAVIFSETGCIEASGKGYYSLLFPQKGQVEQDPEEIYQGILAAVKEALATGIDPDEIGVITFSAQIAAQLLVDEKGVPLTNLISWMDGRAQAECDDFIRTYTPDQISEMSGIDMVITASYSISKLRWMQNHIPEIVAKAHKFIQIKDFVIYRLTGEWVSDVTSMKGLVHAGTGELVPQVLEFTDSSPKLFPTTQWPNTIAGYLKENVAGFEGIKPGIPVITGWNDMNAAFLGMGAMEEGCIGLDITGTSEHLGCTRISEQVPKTRYAGINRVPYLEKKDCFYGVTSSGGQAVEWFVRDLMQEKSVTDFFERVFENVDENNMMENRSLLFLPYIEGERNPWNNPDVRGVFFGLARKHRQADLAWAVLEGVCFALRAIFDRLPEKPEKVIVSGGASFNERWNQMKADVMGVPFVRLDNTEAGCTGAAILALSALNPEKDLGEIAKEILQPAKIYRPDYERKRIYDEKYKRFLKLFHAVEPFFSEKEEEVP